MWSKIPAIIFLCCCINSAVAGPRAIHVHRRDGPTTPSTITDSSTSQSSAPTQTGIGGSNRGDSTGTQPATTLVSVTTTANSTSSSSSSSASRTTNPVSVSAIISNINGPVPTSSFNSSPYNCMAGILIIGTSLLTSEQLRPLQKSYLFNPKLVQASR